MQRHRLASHANEAATDATLLNQPSGDILDGVYANRKTDALRGQDNGRVDADDLTARIDQRPPGITRVQRGVGLDHVVHEATGLSSKGTAQSANDAGRDGALETVRIADRDRELAHADLAGFTQGYCSEIGRINPQDRQVCFRVFAHQVGIRSATVAQRDLDLAGAVDNVAIGQEQTVRADDKPGTTAAPPPIPVPCPAPACAPQY